MVRYDRAPSERLISLLDGPLEPLRRTWKVAGLPLDLQLREGNVAQLYCGLTSLLAVTALSEGFKISAHPTYADQSCAGSLLRRWTDDELGFAETLADYLDQVLVGERHTGREGAVQAAWMSVRRPWIPLDREAVLGFDTVEERARVLDNPAVLYAYEAATGLTDREGWAELKGWGDGNELDQLAVSTAGELVLVELKHGRASDVYQAPLQILRYLWQWHNVLEEILPGLCALVAARRRLGLSPESTPDPGHRLRWALAVGNAPPTREARRRLEMMQELVDQHRPGGVGPLELWRLDQRGRPAPL